MGYRDIVSHVEEIYDHKISAAEISSITDKLLPVINEWRSPPLQSVYPIVFMDGMFFKVKEIAWRESILGYCVELREPVISMIREKSKKLNFKDESTDAKNRGGLARSSEEISVMEMERRG
ncbi:mutator family transposase [Trichonephila clavata]|uniref:Mutator family transposase n=1 Tax=Trichonephila clavata TaxID=2740835 RepID=A0A8X6ILF5_TRICU|nr:mutator family transposase [Trichonephila clavata]